MRERFRTRLSLVFGSIFFLSFCYAATDLPPWGGYRGPYGDVISRVGVYERHATDAVNAINYDYRAFDTLGEEFILFSAVLGVMMLLRREEGTSTRTVGKVEDRLRMSMPVRALAMPAILLTVVFGFYIGLHGQLTPGGGFQGGVILYRRYALSWRQRSHVSGAWKLSG
jgi:multicomponent Na+:H+ antiporter subunit B